MAGKGQKARNTATSVLRPSVPSASPDKSESPTPADVTSVLATETFRRELLTSLRKDIGDIIKLEVREVLGSEIAGLRGDINTVRNELQSYQSSVANELTSLKTATAEMGRSLSSCSDDVTVLQREVKRLQSQTESLQNKCEDLEARSRRNNVRIVGVPESRSSSATAVSALLQKAFDLEEAPMIDGSHRSLQPASRRGEQPRVIVARLHYLQDCVNILRLARAKQRVEVEGMTISVYPDYTTQVAKARASFNAVRQQLRGLEGVKYGILYPARLKITYKDRERIFSTPKEAQDYISMNIPTRGASSSE